jgi:NADH dehydrogenase
LRVPLSGVGAKVVTRGYHLYALPANRPRVATDWLNDVVEHRQFVRLGLVQPDDSGLAVAEQADIYYRTDGQRLGP